MTDKHRTDVLQLTPVSEIRFGHDPKAGPAINARVTGRMDGIEALAKTILHYINKIPGHSGLVLPLATVESPETGHLYVIDGNRRLAALQLLVKNGDIPTSHPVPTMVHGVIGDTALEMSLVANSASPLHPVDRFEAMSRHINQMIAAGQTTEEAEAEVSALFTMTPRQVRQALALGFSLSSMVRDAWRAGDINAQTAEAFTLIAKATDQERVFRKLKKSNSLHTHYVKEEAGSADDKIAELVTYVGAHEYRAGGGTVTEDLFGQSHVVSDPELAKRMADAKMDAECRRLVEQDGWEWARQAVASHEHHRLNKSQVESKPTREEAKRQTELAHIIDAENEADGYDAELEKAAQDAADELEQLNAQIELRAYTPEKRAKLGCLVWLDDGRLQTAYGLKAPKVQPAGTTSAAGGASVTSTVKTTKPKKAEPFDPHGGVSNELAKRLAEQITTAAAGAICENGSLALQVVVAQLMVVHDDYSPVKITHAGAGSDEALDKGKKSFAEALAITRKLSNTQLLNKLSVWAGAALRFDAHSASDLPFEDEGTDGAALLDALPPRVINDALRKAWNAEDYFDSVSKAHCLAAIAEAVSPEAARSVQGKPKGDIAKFALANVRKTKWLPPQMRAAGYDGPKSKAPAKKKPARKR